MIYKNDSSGAVLAMERHRTGNYGEDDYREDYSVPKCEVCGETKGLYIWNKEILCEHCLTEALWEEHFYEIKEVV